MFDGKEQKKKKSRSKQLKKYIYCENGKRRRGKEKKNVEKKIFIVDTNECVVKWISSA